jgi:hypothetical protein
MPPACREPPAAATATATPNAQRPFLRCTACTQFLGFIDDRGLDPHNPLCHCGVASRQQITGRNNKVPGAVHFVCAEGRCGFYSIGVDEEGRQVVVKEGMVEMLARLKII